MKKLLIVLLSASLLTACGKAKSGKEMGEEVCECSKKANGMDPSDPKRSQAQLDCGKMQTKYWGEIKNNAEKSGEFNKVLSVCADEQIKKSFGQ